MALRSVRCTNCEANLQVDSTRDAAVCEYCGAAFVVEKDIDTYTTVRVQMSPTSLDKNTSNNKTVNRDIISQQIPRPLFLLSYPLMIIGFLLLFGGLLFFLFSLVCWIFGWLGLGGVHVLISIAAFIVGAVAIIMGLSLFGVE